MSTSTKTKTTSAKTVVRKPSVAKATAAKRTAAAEPVAKPVVAPQPPGLRKRDLIEAVVRRSGVKKRDAKPVIEAVLAEMGETLAAGRDMALHPLGRVKVTKEKEIPNGRVMVIRVRQKDRAEAVPLKAAAAE